MAGTPASCLLTLDQLGAPGFTVDTPVHVISIADVAANDTLRAQRLAVDGYSGGAAVDFFRQPVNIALENGPIQVRDQCERFTTATGAAALYADDVGRLDAAAGATPVSTGSLGDAGHATTTTVTDPASGVRLVEFIVEWRVANLVDVLTVRGRDGGTRLSDALDLAHRQTAAELGLATPLAQPSASASPSAHPPKPS